MLASGARLTRGGDVGFATRVGPKVETVLGLSMTSTSVGWVLLDGRGADATTLDDDAFDVQTGAEATAGYTSPHAAAARGAQAIATASGHKVGSVQVTWTEDVEADATALLKSLADLGFDNVHAVPLNSAAQAWGIDVRRANEHTKTGVCILKPDSATLMVVDTGAGSVRTALADTRDCAADLVEWLRTVFRTDGWLPESLHLVGSRKDLDEVAEPIRDALPIPVLDTVDTQLALARGAALATVGQVDGGSAQTAEPPPEHPWRVSYAKKSTTTAAVATDVEASVNQVDAGGSSQAVEPPRSGPRKDWPGRGRPWLLVHAKKLTISAAGVAVVGGALSLAAGSGLNVGQVSMQAADPASGASVTSASVHTVPAPISALPAPRAQPLVAEPPPAPPVPQEPLAVPAEPLAAVEPAPVSVPVPERTVAAAPPANIPAAAPVAPPPATPVAAPTVAQPAPIPPPPVAPLVAPAPVAPPPAAPLIAPAPVAPPPAAAPAAAPAPQEPVDPPPPPDPIQVVLSPLFSGLP